MKEIKSKFVFPNGISVKNRIVMAPMTTRQSHDDGSISQEEISWLERRMRGDFAMVITACAYIQKNGQAYPGQIACSKDSHIPGLSILAEKAKENYSLAILQLFHAGLRASTDLTGSVSVAPNAVHLSYPDFVVPNALADFEIEEIIENFALAAQRAERSGLSGIELHAANGYLFAQFLSKATNLRTDKWGGSMVNRFRFLIETLKRVKSKVSSEFIVGVRLAPEDTSSLRGYNIYETQELIFELARNGMNYLHLNTVNYMDTSWNYPGTSLTNLKRISAICPDHIAIVVCGGITTIQDAEEALSQGATMVALAKGAIANPDWPRQIENPNFSPRKLPLSYSELSEVNASADLITYLDSFHLVSPEKVDV